MADIAGGILEVTRRVVRYQQTAFDQSKQGFLDRGASASFAQGYVDMCRAKGEGMDTDAAGAATDRTPTSFRQWCTETLASAARG